MASLRVVISSIVRGLWQDRSCDHCRGLRDTSRDSHLVWFCGSMLWSTQNSFDTKAMVGASTEGLQARKSEKNNRRNCSHGVCA